MGVVTSSICISAAVELKPCINSCKTVILRVLLLQNAIPLLTVNNDCSCSTRCTIRTIIMMANGIDGSTRSIENYHVLSEEHSYPQNFIINEDFGKFPTWFLFTILTGADLKALNMQLN